MEKPDTLKETKELLSSILNKTFSVEKVPDEISDFLKKLEDAKPHAHRALREAKTGLSKLLHSNTEDNHE